MRRAPRKSENGIYEPNMTPLIDVSLVLVVILMVATPLALQSSIGVSRAADERAQGAARSAPSGSRSRSSRPTACA
jgi:biopolymer transport protein ExbD